MPTALALWWFRRRLRERNFIHRSVYADCVRHLCQPVAVPIRDMPGTDTVQPFSGRANDVCPICRDSNADEYVADSGRQARKLPRRAFQAKRTHGEGSVYRRAEYDVGGEAAAGSHVIKWPVLSFPSSLWIVTPTLSPGFMDRDRHSSVSLVERFLPTN